MEAIQNKDTTLRKGRSHRPRKQRKLDFSSFDRSMYMFIETPDGIILWNRARSMLDNGHRPSQVALILYQDYGVRLGKPRKKNTERDAEALRYFADLVVPCHISAPSIFDEAWGLA